MFHIVLAKKLMKIKIDNNGHDCCKSRLLELIIEYSHLLTVISNVDVDISMKKKHKEAYNLSDILDYYLEDLIMFEIITKEIGAEFKQLWIDTSSEDLGILLEEIITYFGPFQCSYDQLGYSRESKVYNTNKENNFDIVFYNKDLSSIVENGKYIEIEESIIEFHECKKNVCNFIPCKKELLKDDHKRKLDFIKDVHDILNKSLFYIPTFKYYTRGSEEFLKNNGYDFIEILGIKKIMDRYCLQ